MSRTMKHLAAAVATLAITALAPTYGRDHTCGTRSARLSQQAGQHIPCYCGRDLGNLEVTPPVGTRVEAVCALRAGPGKWIDIRTRKASLDRDVDGNLPQGVIYLSGKLVLSGTAWFEPGNAGELWFSTGRVNRPERPLFRDQAFDKIKLGRDADYQKLGAPKPDYSFPKCWTMQVTLEIIDPTVTLEDTDFAGTTARDIVVSKRSARRARKCYS